MCAQNLKMWFEDKPVPMKLCYGKAWKDSFPKFQSNICACGWQAEISYCIFQGIVLRVRVGLLMGIWAFCLYNSAQLAH